eukprot:scaffold82734_cov26-Tisochrysis_lutea.AAC.2
MSTLLEDAGTRPYHRPDQALGAIPRTAYAPTASIASSCDSRSSRASISSSPNSSATSSASDLASSNDTAVSLATCAPKSTSQVSAAELAREKDDSPSASSSRDHTKRTSSKARWVCSRDESEPFGRFGWRTRQARRKARLSSSAESLARSLVRRRVSVVMLRSSPCGELKAGAAVPPDEDSAPVSNSVVKRWSDWFSTTSGGMWSIARSGWRAAAPCTPPAAQAGRPPARPPRAPPSASCASKCADMAAISRLSPDAAWRHTASSISRRARSGESSPTCQDATTAAGSADGVSVPRAVCAPPAIVTPRPKDERRREG